MQKLYKKLFPFAWIAIFIIAVPYLVKSNAPDTDTFFLAATGRYIVENLSVPTINPFVIHEGFSVVIQQWGFDILIYQLYNNFGNAGLFAYILAAYAVTITLLYKYLSLFTDNRWSKACITLIAGFLFRPFATARPTSLTIIVMLALLYCIEKWHQTNKKRYLVLLPVLSLIQINMQAATWPILFVLFVPYLFPHSVPKKETFKASLRAWWNKNKSLLLTIVIMLAVGFINPNGINGILYVFESYGNVTTGIGISELDVPTMMDGYGLMCILSIIATTIFAMLTILKYKDGKNVHDEITRFYLAAGTIILAAMHLRNAWYLILGVMPLFAQMLGFVPAPKANEKLQSNAKCVLKLTAVYILPILVSAVMCTVTPYSTIANEDSAFAPKEAVKYLDALNKDHIVLFNEFNNGAFLEWSGYKVYIDARPELFTKEINNKEDVLDEYVHLTNGTANYAYFQQFLDKYDFTHLIVSDPMFGTYLQYSGQYDAVVVGNGYVLFEHHPVES